jgi:hypothetical protein
LLCADEDDELWLLEELSCGSLAQMSREAPALKVKRGTSPEKCSPEFRGAEPAPLTQVVDKPAHLAENPAQLVDGQARTSVLRSSSLSGFLSLVAVGDAGVFDDLLDD